MEIHVEQKDNGFICNIERKHCCHVSTHILLLYLFMEASQWVWNNEMGCVALHCIAYNNVYQYFEYIVDYKEWTHAQLEILCMAQMHAEKKVFTTVEHVIFDNGIHLKIILELSISLSRSGPVRSGTVQSIPLLFDVLWLIIVWFDLSFGSIWALFSSAFCLMTSTQWLHRAKSD